MGLVALDIIAYTRLESMQEMGGGRLKYPIEVGYIPTPTFAHSFMELSTKEC